MAEIPKFQEQLQSTPEQSEYQQQLDTIKSKYKEEWFDVFQAYLESGIDDTQKDHIIKILSWNDEKYSSRVIKRYMRKNSYPTSETVDQFLEKFPLDSKKEELEEILETQQGDEKIQENENKFSNIIAKFESGIEGENEVNKIIESINNAIQSNDLSEVKTQLDTLQQSDEFKQILGKLHAENPEAYQEVKTAFVALGESTGVDFNSYFNDLETGWENIKTLKAPERTLDDAKIRAVHGENYEVSNGLVVDGDVQIDVSKRPPFRTIGIEGSDFRIESSLQSWVFKEAIYDFERSKQKLQPLLDNNKKEIEWVVQTGLQVVDANLETPQGLEKVYDIVLNSRVSNKDDLKSKIEGFNTQLDAGEPLDSEKVEELKQEILSALEQQHNLLVDKQTELQGQYDVIVETYRSRLDELSLQYKERMTEEDERVRETLKLLEWLGLTRIPQNYLNNILAEIKRWSIVLDIAWFDPANIDLANQDFGEPEVWDNMDKFRSNLTKFANKLYFWNEAWVDENGKVIWFDAEVIKKNGWVGIKTKSEIAQIFKKQWIEWDAWNINLDKIKSNLSNREK